MELYGWDIVYGATTDIINAQLLTQMSKIITSYNYDHNDVVNGIEVKLTSNFGAWAVTGGENSIIEITMPPQQATMALAGTNADTLLKGSPYKMEHLWNGQNKFQLG